MGLTVCGPSIPVARAWRIAAILKVRASPATSERAARALGRGGGEVRGER